MAGLPMPSGFPSAIRAGDAGPPGTRAPQRLVQQRPSAVTHARVWAVALSLAATRAISVDFSSSGYLDVSVPRVPRVRLFYSPHAVWLFAIRVSPFGNPRIEGYLHLPVAYRSLSRPSSAPDAKAFSLRSY